MSFLFGSQKTPGIRIPAAPQVSPADKEAVKASEIKRLKQGRTQRQTLLTGPQGILEPAPVDKKTLLGAG